MITTVGKSNPGRPPKGWFSVMRPRIRKQYPSLKHIKKESTEETYREAIDRTAAGIWHGFSERTKEKLTKKYEGNPITHRADGRKLQEQPPQQLQMFGSALGVPKMRNPEGKKAYKGTIHIRHEKRGWWLEIEEGGKIVSSGRKYNDFHETQQRALDVARPKAKKWGFEIKVHVGKVRSGSKNPNKPFFNKWLDNYGDFRVRNPKPNPEPFFYKDYSGLYSVGKAFCPGCEGIIKNPEPGLYGCECGQELAVVSV